MSRKVESSRGPAASEIAATSRRPNTLDAIPPCDGPELIALVGVPGAGKSTFAQQTGLRVVNIDAIRCTPGVKRHDTYTLGYAALASVLASGGRVVFDALNTQHGTRRRLVQLAQQYKAKATLVYMDTPIPVCIERRRAPKEIGQAHRRIQRGRVQWDKEGWTQIIVRQFNQ